MTDFAMEEDEITRTENHGHSIAVLCVRNPLVCYVGYLRGRICKMVRESRPVIFIYRVLRDSFFL